MRTRRPKGLDSEPRHPVVARHTAHAQNQKVRAQRNVKRWQSPDSTHLFFGPFPTSRDPRPGHFIFEFVLVVGGMARAYAHTDPATGGGGCSVWAGMARAPRGQKKEERRRGAWLKREVDGMGECRKRRGGWVGGWGGGRGGGRVWAARPAPPRPEGWGSPPLPSRHPPVPLFLSVSSGRPGSPGLVRDPPVEREQREREKMRGGGGRGQGRGSRRGQACLFSFRPRPSRSRARPPPLPPHPPIRTRTWWPARRLAFTQGASLLVHRRARGGSRGAGGRPTAAGLFVGHDPPGGGGRDHGARGVGRAVERAQVHQAAAPAAGVGGAMAGWGWAEEGGERRAGAFCEMGHARARARRRPPKE